MLVLLFCLAAGYVYLILPRISRKEEVLVYDKSMFAHRGYHNIEQGIPENSMAAFKAAVDKGYGIELDIHVTKDDHVMVFHDDDLKRMCGDPGSIEHYTVEELKKFRLQGTEEMIPTLEQVLDLVDGKVPILVELKIPGRNRRICEASWRILKNYKGPYMVQSFNSMGLQWYKKHAPHILRGQLSSNLTREKLKTPYALRFLVKNLMANVAARPDFISYKLEDLPNLSVTLCRALFHTPVAVWTLRTEKALSKGKAGYNICIFEKKGARY